MISSQIRELYLNFFKEKGHIIISSASLLPENDSTLLFTNSGMSPLVPYLLGEKHPGGVRLADSQKSFRTEDIEEVGDNRHNTFFEMLGNWSLGDYFKVEQLNWWYEFLVEKLKLDPKKLYQTVYAGDERAPQDDESIQVLKEIFARHGVASDVGPVTLGKGALGSGIELDFSRQRIFAYRDKNWWQRGDAIGELGGPDSETFYDTGKTHDEKFGKHCHLNCDCGRFLEIGNSVFMQYQKTAEGWKELPNKNVDFGGGLERLAMISQNKNNVFSTDLFARAIEKISEFSGKQYQDYEKPFEIIADHIKAATFIMGDDRGVAPSNVDQGYIVRRLLRRAMRYGRQIYIARAAWLCDLAQIIVEDYGAVYPELARNTERIKNNIHEEELKFQNTLERGLLKFNKNITQISDSLVISGEEAFDLYQTYGFPLEMTQELANEKGLKVDVSGFDKELKKHQELSRTASAGKFKGGLADASMETTRLHTAAHLMLESLRQVLGNHVEQKGSNITSERLRFDFSHGEKMTLEQIQEVEKIVNAAIQADALIVCEEKTLEEAKGDGAIGVFESKYGERVKVYTAQKNNRIYSKEICGGPHVARTGELGQFKIIKEESSSAGVRRIKAILEKAE